MEHKSAMSFVFFVVACIKHLHDILSKLCSYRLNSFNVEVTVNKKKTEPYVLCVKITQNQHMQLMVVIDDHIIRDIGEDVLFLY